VRIIGVLDLSGGRAVHARGGRRETYAPVQAVAGAAIDNGDAIAVARAYVDRLGIGELYAADLDALGGRAPEEATVAGLAAIGVPLLLDSGATSVDRARRALALGAARVVVALETLDSFDTLRRICDEVGGRRVAFSLDLRDGQPIVASNRIAPNDAAHELAARARDAGAGAVIVIDVARVGTGSGLDLVLIARVREATAGMTLLAGGGVRGVDDLERLAAAGCDAALVATALHDGRIGREAILRIAGHGLQAATPYSGS